MNEPVTDVVLPPESEIADRQALSWLEGFLEHMSVERGLSENTVRAYRVDLLDYVRWAERSGVEVLKASHRHLRLYLGDLDRAQYARTTINRRLSALKSFYAWMSAIGAIESDPADVLQGPKQPKGLPYTIQPAEMVKILSVYDDRGVDGEPREQSPSDMRNQALLELLYACGARIAEASGLLSANVDLTHRQVKLIGKGNKERIVPIHDMAVSSMTRYLHFGRPKLLGAKQCEYFFVSTRANRMGTDAMRKMFKTTLQLAGVDQSLSPHAMRHTFATDVLRGGADLRSVQEMLGHVSLSTTQIYTHLSPERLREVHGQAHPRSTS